MFDYNEVVSNIAVYGLEESIIRSKYPMAVDVNECTNAVTPRTLALGSCETGTGHDQFLTGIIVQFDLTFTIKAWTEAERYHFFDFVSSQSTMHRLPRMKIAEQCIKYTDSEVIRRAEELVAIYNADPSEDNYLRLIYSVPVGLRLTAGMTTNYRQLKTIYYQRRNHRLPEWRAFCKFLETLPMFMKLISGGK